MENEEKCDTKCNRCGTYRFASQFFNDKKREMKSCQICRDKDKIYRKNKKCPHGRKKNMCKECGGGSVCPHNRIRSVCKDCKGGAICEHNRTRSRCKDCKGGAICEHNRIRSVCKECGGGSVCPHNRIRSVCKECGGSFLCNHNIRKDLCKECCGSQICPHNRQKSHCKDCMNDEQKIEYIQKTMIHNSRIQDKKKDRYDADNFIDKCFLEGLFEDSKTCHYCDVEFTYNELCNTFVTIERLNNSIGHIKSNCVLACWYCNQRHQ